jgi:CzcA family heavy metal efflux pump
MLTHWVHNHHRSFLFLLIVLAIGGLVSSLTLPVALFPPMHFPRVVVDIESGDRPAERMATEVTYLAEEAVRAVEGVRNIRSTTSRGSAEISINFDWDQDMIAAMLQVESAVNQVISAMPPGTTFSIRRMDPTVFPVICYSLISDSKSGVELYDLAQYQIRPLLTAIHGVAKIDVMGGGKEEIRVDADPAKLASYGLSLADVGARLTAANVLTAVGHLEDHCKLYLIMADTRFVDLPQIAATVIKSDANGIVRLGDVAKVYRSAEPVWSRVTADGHDAVIFQIYQQPGGNTVQIAHDVKARLAEFQRHMPPDVKVANWYDQSQLIISSARSVRNAVLVGVVLAVLILLIFLRNLKTTLIAAIIVPAVLAVTVLMLFALKMSFNIMTLGGMAAAVGLIIDDSIVLIEHIIRRLRGGDGPPQERVKQAATEFAKPLTGSSTSTIIIFVPLAFLSGVTGAFFKALSLTMAASLLVSYLAAYLAVPLLASRLLNEKDARQKEHGPLTWMFHVLYRGIMQRLLAHPRWVLALVTPLLIVGYYGYRHIGSGFMPKMDEGGFILDYKAPPGMSLSETDRLLRAVEAILQQTPEVQTYSRRTGLQLGGGVTESSEGDFFVRLVPMPRRGIEQVMDEVRDKVQRTVPGLDIELLQLMEDVIGDLTAVPQPIEVELFSDDGKVLNDLAPKVAAAIQKVPGVVDVYDGLAIAGDALDIKIDRDQVSLEGMDGESVAQMLTSYLTGQVATQIQRGSKMVGVRLWVPENYRRREADLGELQLQAPDGHVLPLNRIATLTPITGQPQIKRDDLKRMVAVTGRISGRDMGSTIHDVRAVLDRPGLIPTSVYDRLGGLYEQQQIAFRGLIVVLVAAVVLVFLLLLFLYERFRVAAAMLLTTLLATAAVFVGLWLTGTELNITSMMGLTMVVGIVTEVSIFYFSEYRELGEMALEERFITAGINRMRPIAMTTLAAILALMPLAIGWGQGSSMEQPLAIAIISGLMVQLPLALVVLPTILKILGLSIKDRTDTSTSLPAPVA